MSFICIDNIYRLVLKENDNYEINQKFQNNSAERLYMKNIHPSN
jgi:hypothetical protein